jgi:hypothetical protein
MKELRVRFSRSIFDDEFFLIAPRVSQEARASSWPLMVWTMNNGGADASLNNFSPEDVKANIGVWCTILGMLLVGGITLFVLEGHTNDVDFPVQTTEDTLARSLFNQIQGFVGMGDYRFSPETHAGRFVVIMNSVSHWYLTLTLTLRSS